MNWSGAVKKAAVLVAACGLAGAAAGQQYRGDGGTLLDRNNQIGSGGKNVKSRDIRDQIWFNNQIITGNAPAGRSFRGYVGYTAPSQFRGVTGTDSQYQFVRDSTASSTVATGVRASDALRYQFNLTTGQSAPAYLAGAYITRRGSDAATALTSTSTSSALRSTADYMTARTLRPTLVGTRRDEAGNELTATASGLLGLTWMRVNPVNPAAPLPEAAGLTTPTGAETIKPVTPGAPAPPPEPTGMVPSGLESRGLGYRSSWDAARTASSTGVPNQAERGLNSAVESSATAARSAAHAQVLDSLRAGYRPGAAPTDAGTKTGDREKEGAPGAATDSKDTMERELEGIRRVLRGESPLEKPAARKPGELNAPGTVEKPPATGEPKKGDEDKEVGKDEKKVSPEVMRALKSLGEKSLDSFTPSTSTRTDPAAYRTHMETGQQMLGEGRYFDAEDRFTRAISAMPSDPLAKAGRIHAQLGAGLFLSASTNLRRMIENHPEVVGLRFDRKLAPQPERAQVVAEQLRHEIDQGSTGMGLEASLLLAYLGRITSDQALTDEGLAAMSTHLPKDDAKDAALYQLLNGVWGAGGTPPMPPTPPAPATPAAPGSPNPAPAPSPSPAPEK